MDIPSAAGYPLSGSNRQDKSFADTLQKESATSAVPQLQSTSARSFAAGDLASGFSYMVPDFIPALGEGMVDAIALGEGANEEMQRYEELTKYR